MSTVTRLMLLAWLSLIVATAAAIVSNIKDLRRKGKRRRLPWRLFVRLNAYPLVLLSLAILAGVVSGLTLLAENKEKNRLSEELTGVRRELDTANSQLQTLRQEATQLRTSHANVERTAGLLRQLALSNREAVPFAHIKLDLGHPVDPWPWPEEEEAARAQEVADRKFLGYLPLTLRTQLFPTNERIEPDRLRGCDAAFNIHNAGWSSHLCVRRSGFLVPSSRSSQQYVQFLMPAFRVQTGEKLATLRLEIQYGKPVNIFSFVNSLRAKHAKREPLVTLWTMAPPNASLSQVERDWKNNLKGMSLTYELSENRELYIAMKLRLARVRPGDGGFISEWLAETAPDITGDVTN